MCVCRLFEVEKGRQTGRFSEHHIITVHISTQSNCYKKEIHVMFTSLHTKKRMITENTQLIWKNSPVIELQQMPTAKSD